MPTQYDVDLYIYDLSQGLARTVGSLILRRPIAGVWHTGIVVYGTEYFFGSNGIQFVQPGGTILGHTYRIMNMGKTEVPKELFEEYLRDLADDKFRYDKYHLLDHNCNTFSDEMCMFLLNKRIPAYITNLPDEFKRTPLGNFLKPLVDEIYSNRFIPSNSSGNLNTIVLSGNNGLGASSGSSQLDISKVVVGKPAGVSGNKTFKNEENKDGGVERSKESKSSFGAMNNKNVASHLHKHNVDKSSTDESKKIKIDSTNKSDAVVTTNDDEEDDDEDEDDDDDDNDDDDDDDDSVANGNNANAALVVTNAANSSQKSGEIKSDNGENHTRISNILSQKMKMYFKRLEQLKNHEKKFKKIVYEVDSINVKQCIDCIATLGDNNDQLLNDWSKYLIRGDVNMVTNENPTSTKMDVVVTMETTGDVMMTMGKKGTDTERVENGNEILGTSTNCITIKHIDFLCNIVAKGFELEELKHDEQPSNNDNDRSTSACKLIQTATCREEVAGFVTSSWGCENSFVKLVKLMLNSLPNKNNNSNHCLMYVSIAKSICNLLSHQQFTCTLFGTTNNQPKIADNSIYTEFLLKIIEDNEAITAGNSFPDLLAIPINCFVNIFLTTNIYVDNETKLNLGLMIMEDILCLPEVYCYFHDWKLLNELWFVVYKCLEGNKRLTEVVGLWISILFNKDNVNGNVRFKCELQSDSKDSIFFKKIALRYIENHTNFKH